MSHTPRKTLVSSLLSSGPRSRLPSPPLRSPPHASLSSLRRVARADDAPASSPRAPRPVRPRRTAERAAFAFAFAFALVFAFASADGETPRDFARRVFGRRAREEILRARPVSSRERGVRIPPRTTCGGLPRQSSAHRRAPSILDASSANTSSLGAGTFPHTVPRGRAFETTRWSRDSNRRAAEGAGPNARARNSPSTTKRYTSSSDAPPTKPSESESPSPRSPVRSRSPSPPSRATPGPSRGDLASAGSPRTSLGKIRVRRRISSRGYALRRRRRSSRRPSPSRRVSRRRRRDLDPRVGGGVPRARRSPPVTTRRAREGSSIASAPRRSTASPRAREARGRRW